MAIRVACPACQANYDIEESFRGKQVVCAKCNQQFQIGNAPPPTVEPVDEVEEVVEAVPARPRKKTPVAAWIALGATFLVVAGVVVFVLIYLINTMSSGESASKPSRSQPVNRGNERDQPRDLLGPLAEDPQAEQPASHVNPPLRSGSAGFHQFTTQVPAPREDVVGQKAPMSMESMPSEVLRRVKRGTVYIQVERKDGGGTGSGFFCFEKGLVVTNAHVLGMMSPSDPQPERVTVVLNSNESDELKLRGTIWHVDRKMDLAVLRVPMSDKLPEPLALVSAETLELTQQVFVIGFPFGESLGKDVSINRTSISSLRRDKGVLREVQTSGGMNPGNSGGPVVDALGRVVGIAVRIRVEKESGLGMKNTGLNFAVPSDYAYHIARGNITELSLFPPVLEGSRMQLPVRAILSDPMRRIRRVSAECWTGPAGSERLGGHATPTKEKGDSDRQTHGLKVADGQVTGIIPLPPCPAGQSYWVQLVIEDNTGKRWTAAHSFKANPKEALKRVPWTPVAHENTAWQTEWCSSFSGHMSQDDGGLGLNLHVQNTWNEPESGSRKQAKFDLGFRLQNQAVPHKLGLALAGWRHAGKLPTTQDDTNGLSKVGKYYQQALQKTMEETMDSLQPALPDRPLQPMESWKHNRDLPLDCLMLLSKAPQMQFSYTYLGIGQHEGRPQAVIALEGRRAGNSENSTKVILSGLAMVDVASRKTTMLYASADVETEGALEIPNFPLSGKMSVAGIFEYRLTRSLANNND